MSTPTKKPFKAKSGQYTVKSKEIITWFNTLTGEQIDKESEDLHAVLQDGVALCKAMNKIKPGCIPSFKEKRTPFNMRDNIGLFLNAAKEYGLNEMELFHVNDLFENQKMGQVVACIQALSALAKKKGFAGPFMEVLADEDQPAFSKKQLAETAKNLNLVQAGKAEEVNEVAGELVKSNAAAKTEAKPAESKPVEAKPVESKPVEAKPVESKLVEQPKAVESKPVEEPKAAEVKPVEAKPEEAKPAEVEPQAQPAEETPKKHKKHVTISNEVDPIDENAEMPMAKPKELTEAEVDEVMKEMTVDEADAEYVMMETTGTGGETVYVVLPENEYKLKGMKKHR